MTNEGCSASGCKMDQPCSCKNSRSCIPKIAGRCSCEDCTESKTCLFYSNRLIRVNPPSPAIAFTPATGDNAECCTTHTINTFESLKHTLELCKNILLTPKATIESLKNLYFHRSAQEVGYLRPSDRSQDGPSYKNVNQTQSETSNKTQTAYCKASSGRITPGTMVDVPTSDGSKATETDKPQRDRLDSKGYVYDLPKNKQKLPTTEKQQQYDDTKANNRDVYKLPKKLNVPQQKNVTAPAVLAGTCRQTQGTQSEPEQQNVIAAVAADIGRQTRLDSRGFVYDLPKLTQKQDFGNKFRPDKLQPQQQHGDTKTNTDDSRGYVYVLPKQQNVPNQKRGTDQAVSKVSQSGTQQQSDNTNTRGYVYDLPKQQNVTAAVAGDIGKQTRLDSRGFVYELPKLTQKLDVGNKFRQNKTEPQQQQQQHGDTKTNTDDSRGYVYVLPKQQNVPKQKKGTDPAVSPGSCRPTILDVKGYVYDLPKVSQSGPLPQNDNTRGYVYELPKQQNVISAVSGDTGRETRLDSKGYVYDVTEPLYEKIDSKTCCKITPESKTNAQKQRVDVGGNQSPCFPGNVENKKANKGVTCCRSTPEFDKYKQLLETLSGDMQQTKSCVCKGTSKNTFDSSECCNHDSVPTKSHKGSCHCKQSKSSHDSKKIDKVELCKNILEIQRQVIETLNSMFQPKNCSCSTAKPDAKSCRCSESTKNPEQSGHRPHKCQHKPNECVCGENLPKQHKCQHKSSESHKSHGRNTDSSVFLVQPQKYPIKPFDKSHCQYDETQKRTCCNESTKVNKVQYKSKRGNTDSFSEKKDPKKVFEVKPQICPIRPPDPTRHCVCDEKLRKCCYCSESTKIKKPIGYVVEVSKDSKTTTCNEKSTPQREKSGCESCNKKYPSTQTSTQKYIVNRIETKNTISNLKKGCECGEQTKGSAKSSTLKVELQERPEDPSNFSYKITSCNCGCDDGHSKAAPKNTHSMPINTNVTRKENCACKVDKPTQELCKIIIENKNNATETLKSNDLTQKSNCSCKGSQTQDSKKADLQKNTSKYYTDLLGSQKTIIEALKKVYLQKTDSRKDGTGLYSDVLKSEKASNEALKKINLQKTSSQNDTTNKLCTPKIKTASNKDSCCNTATPPSKQTGNLDNVGKISKNEIMKQLKEALEACHCKVCERIADKNEQGKSKPYESKSPGLQVCNKGQSKDAAGTKKHQSCECKPCDCLNCTMKSPKPCDCEQCQCLECQALSVLVPQTLVVAPVGENIPRVPCTCSPCDCIECEPSTASSVRHEMSTETNRHTLCRCEVCLNESCDQNEVDTCNCQTCNKVMSKPVEKDTRDFDIRTVSVVHNMFRDNTKKIKRHSTLAMFATVSNTFPTFTSNNSKSDITKTCNCGECKCLSCISAINLRNISNLNSAKCHRCECKLCRYHTDYGLDKKIKNKSSCRGFTCDCCDGDRHVKYGLCKCNSCQCTECESKSRKIFRDRYRSELCYRENILPKAVKYPLKRGTVFTPSTHQTKVKNSLIEKQRLNTIKPSAPIQKMPSDKAFSKIKNGSKYQIKPNIFKTPSEFTILNKVEAVTNINKHNHYNARYTSLNKCEILKCDAYTQCQDRNIENSSIKKNTTDNESCFSGLSSFETSPKTSCHRDYDDSTSPISRTKAKSWDSSCNSSGHDYAEYLIKFPKSTVETCLTDVMELDMDKILSLDKFDISPDYTNSIEQGTTRISHDNISEKEQLSLISNDFDLVDDHESKLNNANQTESLKPYRNESSRNEVNNTKDGYKLTNSRSLSLTKSPVYYRDVENLVNSKELYSIDSHPNEHVKTGRLRKGQRYFSVNDINTQNIEDDYKRAQKTLKDTKQFSLELMRLLEMYEKANKEFETLSDKLKKSHDSLVNFHNTEQKRIFRSENKISNKCLDSDLCIREIEHELQAIHLKGPFISEKVNPSWVICDMDSNTILRKDGRTNLCRDTKPVTEKYASEENLESMSESIVARQIENNISQYHENVTGIHEGDSSSRETNENFPTSHNLGTKKKERSNTKGIKKYSKLVKRTIIIAKKVSIKNTDAAEAKSFVKYYSNDSTSTTLIGSTATANDDHNRTAVNVLENNSAELKPDTELKGELNHLMRKLNTVFSKSEEVSVSTSTGPQLESNHVYVCNMNYSTIIQDTEEARRWSILKKKIEMNTPSTKVKGVCDTLPLGLNIKEAAQSVSLKTSSIQQPANKIFMPYQENKALAELQDEARKLLDLPVLQPQTMNTQRPKPLVVKKARTTVNLTTLESIKEAPIFSQQNKLELKETPVLPTERNDVNQFQKEAESNSKDDVASQIRELLNLTLLRALLKKKLFDETDNSASPGSESSCSCESLKVGSVDVRKMSEHSVLVRWNVPRDLSSVQGYELLVDGRALPTIFSPSNSTAVVSCLPEADRMLLTVRTITPSGSTIGHYPATTVIYRPQNT